MPKYTVLAITTLGALMTSLDSTIVYLAVPAMQKYFTAGIAYLTLVIVAYLISTTSTMIPSGSLATKFGKKNIYIIGFIIFTLSSLLIAVSPNIISAILFRAIEGVGAGIMGTVGIPILLAVFPQNEHGRAIGINSIAWSIGALLGPVLGGILVTFDWRYIFLINVPIGVTASTLGYYVIPGDTGNLTTKVSIKNMAGFLSLIVPLTVGISFLNYYWLLASLAMAPFFVLSQRGETLIPTKLLMKRSYIVLLISTSLQALSFFAVSYALSIYLQSDIGLIPLVTGIVLAANPIASLVTSPLSGYLFDRTRRGSEIMLAGLLVQGSSILILAYMIQNISVVYIFAILFVSGIGGTLFWTSSTVLAMNAGGESNRSIASGTIFTLRNIALVIGLTSFPLFIAGSGGGIASILTFQTDANIFLAVKYYLIAIALLSYISLGFTFLYRIIERIENKQDS
ncbi:MAG: MFS transporter [Conexivisphaerales archaeon]